MAHECPTCGSCCYCNGDIDDCVLNFRKDQSACTCCVCTKCGEDGEDCICPCPGCGEENFRCLCDEEYR